MELYFKESLKEADESSLDTLDIAPLQRLISYINENKTKWIDPYCLNKFGLLSEVDLQTISVKTKGQASNSLWAEIRRGMMTASNFHRIRSRMQTLKSNPTESAGALLRHLCCVPPAYASLPRSLAWGRKYEAKAIKHYEKLMAKRHRRMKVRTTGLCIFDENFLMGVSPDAVCSCSCEKGTCSRQWLVEVKCPYTDKYKHPKAAAVHNGCFYSVVQKKWILSRTHKHYSQCYAHIRIGFSPFLLDVCLALCCLVIVASYWLVSSRIAASCCFLFAAGQCRVQTCYICVLSCLTVIRAFAGSHSCGI